MDLYSLFVLNLVCFHLMIYDVFTGLCSVSAGLACFQNHKGSSLLLKKKHKIFQMLGHFF